MEYSPKAMKFTSLFKAIKTLVEAETGIACYDKIPDAKARNETYYKMSLRMRQPTRHKTYMLMDYYVDIETFAPGDTSTIPLYEAVDKLEEAMQKNITLTPKDAAIYQMFDQSAIGVANMDTALDHTDRGITQYRFRIIYGLCVRS